MNEVKSGHTKFTLEKSLRPPSIAASRFVENMPRPSMAISEDVAVAAIKRTEAATVYRTIVGIATSDSKKNYERPSKSIEINRDHKKSFMGDEDSLNVGCPCVQGSWLVLLHPSIILRRFSPNVSASRQLAQCLQEKDGSKVDSKDSILCICISRQLSKFKSNK